MGPFQVEIFYDSMICICIDSKKGENKRISQGKNMRKNNKIDNVETKENKIYRFKHGKGRTFFKKITS